MSDENKIRFVRSFVYELQVAGKIQVEFPVANTSRADLTHEAIHIFGDAWVMKQVADECNPKYRHSFYAELLVAIDAEGCLEFKGEGKDWSYTGDMRNGFLPQMEILAAVQEACLIHHSDFNWHDRVEPKNARLWLMGFASIYGANNDISGVELYLIAHLLIKVACGQGNIVTKAMNRMSICPKPEEHLFIIFVLTAIRDKNVPWDMSVRRPWCSKLPEL